MGQIGRYRIVGELGRGAMGMVQLATDPAIGRYVAIKTIRIRDIDDRAQQDRLRDRLFREARSAGVLSHPNIVTIYDVDEIDGVAYIAMSYVNGPTLEKALAEQPLPAGRMFDVLRQTAAALDYAHGKGIVHRDVKPGNIMLDEEGHVKITDFGIARTVASSHSTETKSVVGTPNYMSPEQVQAQLVDGRSDQFSLAVIAYEILTGERPFTADHLSTIVYRIVNEDAAPAHRLNGTLSPSIDAVLRKGMAKKAADRFPNCSSFVGALEMACAESRGWHPIGVGMAGSMPTVGVEKTAPRKRDTIIAGGATLGATQSLAGGQPPQSEQPSATPTVAELKSNSPASASSSMILAVAASLLLLALAAAIFLHEAGMLGETPVSVAETSAARQTQPVPVAPETATTLQESPAAETGTTASQTDPVPPPSPAGTSKDSTPIVEMVRPAVREVRQPHWEDIRISTNPPDAKVVLDGNSGTFCFAPCALRAYPGQHHITISKPGYENLYQDVRLGQEALDLGEIHLTPIRGTLMLSTDPEGARIRINGTEVEQLTPTSLNLKPGVYAVTVEKAGISKTENVAIGDGISHRKIPLTR